MRPRKNKKMRITERDYIIANRKAAREEEIRLHGKPISLRTHLHKSKKTYSRKGNKKAITGGDDGL